MKEKLLVLANFAIFLLATLILGTIQTSLWFQMFGYFAGPALWLPCLIYFALSRSTLETVIFSYLVGVVLSTMTAMPEGILMIVCLMLAISTQLFKQRIYWTSSSYFMMVCGAASLLFHFFHWGASAFLEDSTITSPQIMDWLIEALLTPLAAAPLYPLFRWIDKVTDQEPSTEISAQIS